MARRTISSLLAMSCTNCSSTLSISVKLVPSLSFSYWIISDSFSFSSSRGSPVPEVLPYNTPSSFTSLFNVLTGIYEIQNKGFRLAWISAINAGECLHSLYAGQFLSLHLHENQRFIILCPHSSQNSVQMVILMLKKL